MTSRTRRHGTDDNGYAPGRGASLALGYASAPPGTPLESPEVEMQCSRISSACGQLGLQLVEIVRDGEPPAAEAPPGLTAALERIRTGEASCLVVSEIARLSGDVGGLAATVERLERDGGRLIVLDVGLDTATPSGHIAVSGSNGVIPAQAEPAPEAEPAQPEPEPVERRPAPTVPPPPVAPPARPMPAARPAPAPAAPPVPAPTPPTPPAMPPRPVQTLFAIGYASVPADGADGHSLDEQRQAIEREAERVGVRLIEAVVREREPKAGRALERSGLSYLLGRIATGEATCVIVAGLDRLSRSVAELGSILQWIQRNEVRLIVAEPALDTADPSGRATVATLASVAGWERQRISERTRKGLAAARAKRHASATDWEAIRMRIAKMRADVLNREGVPTQRGGAEWRPSSVQTAAGYKRRPRSAAVEDLPAVEPRRGA